MPLAQTPTMSSDATTTGQEMNTIGTQTTNPALPSQMPNLNIAIPEPTPITTHHSTTVDTKGIKSGTVTYVCTCMLTLKYYLC